MELAWFRKFQDNETINETTFGLSDAGIARKHTTVAVKLSFWRVSL